VEYLSLKEIEIAIKHKFGDKNIQELLVQEEDLIKERLSLKTNPELQEIFEKAQKQISEKIISQTETKSKIPSFPYREGPRPYQIEAYQNWVANDYKGLFAMATGTGKTITSLNCLLQEYQKTGVYRAIITVPTTALVEQWKKECGKFNFQNIISVSSKENWENNLAFFNTAAKLIKSSFIVIVTYASLPRAKFQSYFKNLPLNTIFIADETHNLGSKGILKLLPKIHLAKRIGLSSTPHRKFDEEGNLAIQDFFNGGWISPPLVSLG
jgi:superfamily II DNA or RNA helicase